MGVQLKLDGMKEFREALRKLPEELAGEASHIVEGAANGANTDVRRVYPAGKTGRMIRDVQVTKVHPSKVSAGAVLKSAAHESHLWERGTTTRRTARGWNRGAMPEAPETRKMVPIVVKWRRWMYQQLADLLRRNGFVVSGL